MTLGNSFLALVASADLLGCSWPSVYVYRFLIEIFHLSVACWTIPHPFGAADVRRRDRVMLSVLG